MNDKIREQLLGYVLGALDAAEQRSVEERLERDPEWRQELEAVQKSLEPLADAYEEFDPPAGLVDKTCVFVAQESERLQVVRPCRAAATLEGGFDTRSRWRLADWIVLGGICAAAAALFFPAILNSRFSSRVAFCQNNLRELGFALTQFSERTQERFFPGIPTEGNRAFAGFYSCQLRDAGLMPDARFVICPESSLANFASTHRIPSIVEIDSALGNEIIVLQRNAGGTYAYTLGYQSNGRLQIPRNQGRAHYVIMADSPLMKWGDTSHGNGLNLLYEDMHIQFVLNRPGIRIIDDPFHNRWGLPEAGTDSNDAVVAPSYAPPLLTNVSRKLDR